MADRGATNGSRCGGVRSGRERLKRDREITSAEVGGSWEWRRAGHGSCGGGRKGKPGWRLGETMG